MEIISWENLDEYIRKGIPAQLPVSKDSHICFLIEDNGNSLGLRLPEEKDEDVKPSPYQELNISKKVVQGGTVIELTLRDVALFRTFYHFASEISQLILVRGMPVTQAIERCLGDWSQLLVRRKLLEETEQIGLAGELCFLSALIASRGQMSFNSWLGPIRERHDFRLDASEIEVKSTVLNRRKHRIHGLEQLEPSSGMQLYLLSLQFEPAGNAMIGRTLVERVHDVRHALSGEKDLLKKFETYLKGFGYEESDSRFYSQRLKFRNPPVLIPMDAAFPRLTGYMIDRLLPEGTSHRITYVEYELDVEGLGYPEGSPEFEGILNGLTRMEMTNE